MSNIKILQDEKTFPCLQYVLYITLTPIKHCINKRQSIF